MMSGLDVHYDLGKGHPLLGRRMPDLDLVTAQGPVRASRAPEARPVLINFGEPGARVDRGVGRPRSVDRRQYEGAWELPVVGAVPAPTAVLIRPDGHVAWIGEGRESGLVDALASWFGPPSTV